MLVNFIVELKTDIVIRQGRWISAVYVCYVGINHCYIGSWAGGRVGHWMYVCVVMVAHVRDR